jgi:hypothetical protein
VKRFWSIKTTAVAAMLTLAAWPVAIGMIGPVAAASGSWYVAGTYGVNVTWDQDPAPGTVYAETLVLTQAVTGTITGDHLGAPCSPNCTNFTITSGSVAGNAITIVATSPFTLTLTGTIASDGSMSGTWADGADGLGRTGTWETTSGAATFLPPVTTDCTGITPGTYAGYSFVSTTYVPANSASGVNGPAFENGVAYLVESQGVYGYASQSSYTNRADAEWSFGYPGTSGWVKVLPAHLDGTLDLMINSNSSIDWGDYSSTHTYTHGVIGTGSPVNFLLGVSEEQPGYWSDNTGGLCVSVFKDNVPPVVSDVSVPSPMAINTPAAITAVADDSSTGGSDIASAEYTLDGGTTWNAMSPTDGSFDSPTESVEATASPPPGIYTVCVRATDAAGNTSDPVCAQTQLAVYDAYAELSGTAGGPSGNGKSLAFSFDGWVATAGDAILGKVEVNYRILRTTCTYTPDANSGLTILSGVATLTNWHSSCAAGEYNLTLWDRDLYPQRGKVSVDGPGTTYDIGLQFLATGNVHVRDLTPGTVNGFFSAPDSRYYSGLTDIAPLYGTGPIEFTWTNSIVTGGFWNEVVPPTTGTIYYNIAAGDTVSGGVVTLHFIRTVPTANDFYLDGSFTGTTLSGTAQGPYLFVATGVLIVS